MRRYIYAQYMCFLPLMTPTKHKAYVKQNKKGEKKPQPLPFRKKLDPQQTH
jgi:hypothetical protein